jgi:hypothetical protein
MNDEIGDALRKVGKLLAHTGLKLKQLASRDPNIHDLADIHETLVYCADAISKIAEAIIKKDSRGNHEL